MDNQNIDDIAEQTIHVIEDMRVRGIISVPESKLFKSYTKSWWYDKTRTAKEADHAR